MPLIHTHALVLALCLVGVVACRHPVAKVVEPPANLHLETKVAGESERQAVQELVENFQRVHFALDAHALDGEARAALDLNAAILKRHPGVRVEVQGHADQRGTVDYNLALGQRRAGAVVDHLRHQGVSGQQLHSVSLGEEAPLELGAGETAWSANRRAEFRVTTNGQSVVGTVSRHP